MSVENQQNILRLLADHELKLSELYRNFAVAGSEDREFWLSVSEEEIDHSHWIGGLAKEISNGQSHLSSERLFGEYLLLISIEKVNGLIVANNEVPYSREGALEVSWQYEKSLIEAGYF